jgi:hypothetical protein
MRAVLMGGAGSLAFSAERADPPEVADSIALSR